MSGTVPLFAPPSGLRFEPVSTWDPRIRRHIDAHYTGSDGAPPGKKQAWLIWEDRAPVGCVGLGEPSFKLAPRRRLGLADARPLPRTVSCWIYRVQGHSARASEILASWLAVADARWAERYGWDPVHMETMIGAPAEGGRTHHGGALGACFRRCGFRSLGWTTGRSARRPDGSSHGARVWTDAEPKLVLYRGPLPRLPVAQA